MKIVGVIARILLGLMFVVFGLNGFLHFLHMPPEKISPLGMQYMGAIMGSHMILWAFGVQLVTGVLLLLGLFVPLALVLLGPVIANILLFHGLMDPGGILNGIIAFVLWLLVFLSVRSSFAGIFRARA